MAKAGRPQAEISQKQFEAMCHIQATQAEICEVLGVDAKTIRRWCRNTYGMDFSRIYNQKRAGGKISLRRYQYDLAKRSAAMAIWLGQAEEGPEEQKLHIEALKQKLQQPDEVDSGPVIITGEDEIRE